MRPKGTLGCQGGFTYIAVLVMVVVLGIAMGQAAQVWKTAMQREKEAELLFRGMEVRAAMQRYYYGREVRFGAAPAVDTKKPNLKELEDLLKDPSSPGTVRYVRPSALVDPMTGEKWDPVTDQTTGRIIGVRTKSEAAPIKKGNFPWELMPQDFEDKNKYSEWLFLFNRIPVPATGGSKGPD